MQFHQPGVQWWWQLRRSSYAKPFRTYLDNSTPPNMKSMFDTFRDKA